MKAYSLDLRQRVLAACQSAERTLPQVAAQFSVSVSFISKLVRRQRTSGSAEALPPRGGPAPVLGQIALDQLTSCLQQQPDATLAELGTALLAAGGPVVSRATLARAVIKLGWRRKKRLSTPPSATGLAS
jgi:transposase